MPQPARHCRTFAVGVAPYDVLLVGQKAYVSNWGGRRPGKNDLTGPAGRGTVVRVDPVKHIASEGSVSVVDLKTGKTSAEVLTGLHASGLAKTPNDSFVVCCNAAADNLSVIDTEHDKVVATIWTKKNAAELLGAAPNAATFDAKGRRLYVANGSQNAIAVIDFDQSRPSESSLLGMMPVGWYPGAVLVDSFRQQVVCANIKGVPKDAQFDDELGAKGYNSHHYFGSLSLIPIPPDKELPQLSEMVANNMRRRGSPRHCSLPERRSPRARFPNALANQA